MGARAALICGPSICQMWQAPWRCLVLEVWGPLPKALHHLHVCNACTLYMFSCSVYNVYYTALLRNRWIMSHLAVLLAMANVAVSYCRDGLCRSRLWARCLLTAIQMRREVDLQMEIPAAGTESAPGWLHDRTSDGRQARTDR